MSQLEAQQRQAQKQREYQLHSGNLQGGAGRQEEEHAQAELLDALSSVEGLPDDLSDDEVLGQLTADLQSTANLSGEEVRSDKWLREITQLMYISTRPRDRGLHGTWRGVAHGTAEAEMPPMSTKERLKIDTYTETSKKAVSRSKELTVVREVLRSIKESLVRDENSESEQGGILGKIGW